MRPCARSIPSAPSFSPLPGRYGRRLNVWDWTTHTYVQAIDVGEDAAPLEIRFLHNPAAAEGYVGCTISSAVHHFYKTEVRAPPACVDKGVLPLGWLSRGIPLPAPPRPPSPAPGPAGAHTAAPRARAGLG